MMNPHAKAFYRFLAREFNMTIDEFVFRTGVARTTILKILNGYTTPNIETRKKLLKVMNPQQLQELIGGLF